MEDDLELLILLPLPPKELVSFLMEFHLIALFPPSGFKYALDLNSNIGLV